MKLYVAGKFQDYRRVRMMVDFLSLHGHVCAYDWTRTEEFDKHGAPRYEAGPGCLPKEKGHQYAELDIRAAAECDFLVVLADGDLCGAWIEMGAALGQRVPRIFVLDEKRWTIFLEHKSVTRMSIIEFLSLVMEGL